MTTKLGNSVTYHDGISPITLDHNPRNLDSRGLARSCDKLKLLYLTITMPIATKLGH